MSFINSIVNDGDDGNSDFVPERQTYVGPPGRDPRTQYQEPKFPKKMSSTLPYAVKFHLIILFRLCRANINNLPLKVFWEILHKIVDFN